MSYGPELWSQSEVMYANTGLYALRNFTASYLKLPDKVDPLSLPTDAATIQASYLIKTWLAQPPESISRIMWLSGIPEAFVISDDNALAGSGYRLIASFAFSSRKGEEQMRVLVPTLARAIAWEILGLDPYIGRAAARDPEFLSANIDAQFNSLILSPLWDFATTGGHIPNTLIWISGLDLYCDRRAQELLLSTVDTAMATLRIPLRFLFTSRHRSSEGSRPPLHPRSRVHVEDATATAPSQKRLLGLRRFIGQGSATGSSRHGFPRLVQAQRSSNPLEAYYRSMIMLGHGIPLWKTTGYMDGPLEHQYDGVQIGDVMYMDGSGIYHFIFNIFRDRDDPANIRNPHDYEPLTLDPSEVIRDDHYFKPGEFITSTGVSAKKITDNPLYLKIKSKKSEGSILVLPAGASREDLISTTRFHQYVQRWAPYWYKKFNVTNGSIFLVTGCDKTSDFACACFPSTTSSVDVEIQYHRVLNKKGDHPWKNEGKCSTTFADLPYPGEPGDGWPQDVKRLCVFIRGMRIALGSSTWSSSVFVNRPIEANNYTQVIYKLPLLNYISESALVQLGLRDGEDKALKKLWTSYKQFIHPIFLVGPQLLKMHPTASVLLLNDSDWCSLTTEGCGTLVEIEALVDKIHQHYVAIEHDGIISLSMKKKIASEGVGEGAGHSKRRGRRNYNLISVVEFTHEFRKKYTGGMMS